MDGTKIADRDQLKHLSNLKSLKAFSAAECTLATDGGADIKKEVLIALMDDLPKLKTINGDGWDAEFLKECKDERAERVKAAEEARKAAEAAAANPEGDGGEGEGGEGGEEA